MEAIRLVDLLQLDLEHAAESMKVSRRTLSRDLKKGRMKLAESLVIGKAVVVKGGDYEIRTKEEV
jgi:predicted DNA-binding protein (UPF0251 family)